MISHTATQCSICGKPLTGKQTKFCSQPCKSKGQVNSIYATQQARGIKRKKDLIALKGGSCTLCGYSKCLAALHFHHVDPKLKSHQLDARHLSNLSWDSILKEALKCILVCGNCHAEIHHGA